MITEDRRRIFAQIAAHGGWWGAVVLLGINIALGGAEPAGDAPPWLGLIIVVLIGVGIAGGTSLSRMRLAEVITRALEVGASVAASGAQERQRQIIELLREELNDRKAHDHE